MKKGKLIVIEGTDCSGKATQSKILKDRLLKEGYKCVLFSFPMYDTPTGKIIGGSCLGKPEIGPSFFGEEIINFDPKIATLYYAADRRYNIKKFSAYLEKGYYVILDRYTTSNLAHQGGKIKNKEDRFKMYKWIETLEYDLLELPKPDITIFLYVPFKFTKILKSKRDYLDIIEKDDDHIKNAEKSYIELADRYKWKTINCIKNDELRLIEDISDDIFSFITK